jgi:hypothetical protein
MNKAISVKAIGITAVLTLLPELAKVVGGGGSN